MRAGLLRLEEGRVQKDHLREWRGQLTWIDYLGVSHLELVTSVERDLSQIRKMAFWEFLGAASVAADVIFGETIICDSLTSLQSDDCYDKIDDRYTKLSTRIALQSDRNRLSSR